MRGPVELRDGADCQLQAYDGNAQFMGKCIAFCWICVAVMRGRDAVLVMPTRHLLCSREIAVDATARLRNYHGRICT
jgi:hypothetical protein